MKKEDFNFEGIQLQENTKTFSDDASLKQFYDYLETCTKDKFEFFDLVRKKSKELAMKKHFN